MFLCLWHVKRKPKEANSLTHKIKALVLGIPGLEKMLLQCNVVRRALFIYTSVMLCDCIDSRILPSLLLLQKPIYTDGLISNFHTAKENNTPNPLYKVKICTSTNFSMAVVNKASPVLCVSSEISHIVFKCVFRIEA